jgi:WD40 repeat protein
MLYEVHGLAGRVLSIGFSSDSRFLVASGENCLVIVFDCFDGEMVYSRRSEGACRWCGFAPSVTSHSYTFVTIYDGACISNQMTFDLSTMSYIVDSHKLGGIGLSRIVTSACIIDMTLFISSTTGDLCLYGLSDLSLRGALTLPSSSISLFTPLKSDKTKIIVVTGSNSLFLVDISEVPKLKVVKTLCPDRPNAITSVITNQRSDVFVSLSDGRFEKFNICENSTQCLAFRLLPSQPLIITVSDSTLVCGTTAGQLVSWDIPSWSLSSQISLRKSPVTALHVSADGTIFVGQADGSISVFQPEKGERPTLEIPIGHKGEVSGLHAFGEFFASVGLDCNLRLWKLRGKVVPVTEFSTAPASLGGVIIGDTGDNVYVYTHKREVIQFSLKMNKMVKKMSALKLAGNIVGMTSSLFQQRDFVIVTAHYDCRFIVWDFDYDCPLKVFSVPAYISCISRYSGGILAGTCDGGYIQFCVDSNESEPLEIGKNALMNRPVVSIAPNPSGGSILLMSDGTVILFV